VKVRIERKSFEKSFIEGYNIWFYQDIGNDQIDVLEISKTESDNEPSTLLRRYPRNESIPPSFFIPSEALEALVKEASGILPPSEATVEALNDTREVRDRLLTLVEKHVLKEEELEDAA